MRGKQVKELKQAILQDYLSEKEKEKIYNEVKDQPGDTRKLMKEKIWANSSKRDFLYRKGKEIFNNTAPSKRDVISL